MPTLAEEKVEFRCTGHDAMMRLIGEVMSVAKVSQAACDSQSKLNTEIFDQLRGIKEVVDKNLGHAEARDEKLEEVQKSINKIDLNKIKVGEILVANFTTPEYVPAMKKAAAIVTDDGGITSHAAIVARELKKPCVIGTKISTKVLRDGDLVEVDANKGIVKKICEHLSKMTGLYGESGTPFRGFTVAIFLAWLWILKRKPA